MKITVLIKYTITLSLLAILFAGCQKMPQVRPLQPAFEGEHVYKNALMDNALEYLNPEHELIDPTSSYPFEGWNSDPERGLYLRSFTQLTAIGEWIEILANIAGGHLETTHMPPDQAFDLLTKAVSSLIQDQQDPNLNDRGLLVNFLGFDETGRMGPLASQVDKRMFLDEFGEAQTEAIWTALQEKGWIATQEKDTDVDITRSAEYGLEYFDGALLPFNNEEMRQRIMKVLDHRVIQVVFGDNANLSASVAKTIGILLAMDAANDPRVPALIEKLESFLDTQSEGYASMYDPAAGLCFFGWNATKQRTIGWMNPTGLWVNGHSDYLVNEFRAPTLFAVLRFDLPMEAYGNLGFKMKPYQMQDGTERYALAPWSGSAFQPLGLSLFMDELRQPAWQALLANFVGIELDYSQRNNLPGFLSESYTGEGTAYSGEVGIQDIAVTEEPRITNCPSLYTLGIAYSVLPDKVEGFLADNWNRIATLFTDHGPWEGYDVTTRRPIKFQTSAHTFSLILGLLGNGSEQITRYLAWKNLDPETLRRTSEPINLLDADVKRFAWSNQKNQPAYTIADGAFHLNSEALNHIGLAFVPPGADGINLSGGELVLRYRSSHPIGPASIIFKPVIPIEKDSGVIPKEILARIDTTGDEEGILRAILPPTPGLWHIKEIVITFGEEEELIPLDLTFTAFTFTPIVQEQ